MQTQRNCRLPTASKHSLMKHDSELRTALISCFKPKVPSSFTVQFFRFLEDQEYNFENNRNELPVNTESFASNVWKVENSLRMGWWALPLDPTTTVRAYALLPLSGPRLELGKVWDIDGERNLRYQAQPLQLHSWPSWYQRYHSALSAFPQFLVSQSLG